ncbi:MAG TPA: 50S ribosomal protein L13 [bacterium]|nr:50S ribosomal protein L13 [bacterium]
MKPNNQTTEDLREWYFFDAQGKILGRLATEIADSLRAKKKANFAPNADNGAFVVVINADNFVLTGKKEESKRYYAHTGYLGNLKTQTLPELKKSKPGLALTKAVAGMLPKNKLQKCFLDRLKVYTGAEHPHMNAKFVNVDGTTKPEPKL